jgi:hypothetical protein
MSEQLDMFAAPAAAPGFAEILASREPAVGPDGATWQLVLFGQKQTGQFWGFTRQAPGDLKLSWIGELGLPPQPTPAAAVAGLVALLGRRAETMRAADADRASRKARIEADRARIIAAAPEGWRVFESPATIRLQPDDGSYFPLVYTCDLANNPGYADSVIARLAEVNCEAVA